MANTLQNEDVQTAIQSVEYWLTIIKSECQNGDTDGAKHSLETLTLRHDQLRKKLQGALYAKG